MIFQCFHLDLLATPLPMHLCPELAREVANKIGLNPGWITACADHPWLILHQPDPQFSAADVLQRTLRIPREVIAPGQGRSDNKYENANHAAASAVVASNR